jgi:hypothetical protein
MEVSPERYTRLAQLPERIEFPADLKARVFYDGAGRRLVFRGRMSRSDREKLMQLASDFYYHQAIDRLYMGNPSSVPWTTISAAILILGCLVAAACLWLRG